MKKYLLIVTLLTTAAFAITLPSSYVQKPTVIEKNPELCKMFHTKALEYKKTIRDDDYAKKTLESYEKRVNIYCVN